MSMIKIEDLTFAYSNGSDNIFEHASFQIDTDWKLGFVGRNGRGKTTLLKLLLNQYEYSGKIYSSVSFDYFPYEVNDKSQLTGELLSTIAPLAEAWELIRELSYLRVEAEVLERSFFTLSHGEQTKVLLAALFCQEGHFLLIDEPTNHLDAEAREIVSAYLKKKKGFILVSHDRSFLDGCVDHILSINRASIDVQSGNFSTWLENFERRQSLEAAKNEHLQKDIHRLQQAKSRSAGWSDRIEASKYGNGPVDRGFIGHKSAKMMKRSKAMEARMQQAIEQKSGLLKNVETTEDLKLFPLTYHHDTLVTLSHVVVSYDGKPVGNPISFSVKQGERIVLEGKNGSGKSSLLKLLVGEPIAYTGTIQLGSQLVIAYVPQDTVHLQGSLSTFAADQHIDETLFKAVLRKMGFEREQFAKDMFNFSAGQKKKVLIANSLCQKAHLYLWDEPLNYIDIYTRMQIEALLNTFKPTMILVEHDKTFRDKIATEIIKL